MFIFWLRAVPPNAKESDAWPRRNPRIGKTVLGQPLAQPKSCSAQSYCLSPASYEMKRQTDDQRNRKRNGKAVNEEHRQPKGHVSGTNAELVHYNLVTDVENGAAHGDCATREPEPADEEVGND